MAIQVPDLNPIENECDELKRRTTWICESEGSGEIRYGGMVSDLLSGVLRNHQALYENTQTCYLGKTRLQQVFTLTVIKGGT